VLESFLFEVQPGDPVTLISVGALCVGVGLLACWAPVRRAAKVDPMAALRNRRATKRIRQRSSAGQQD